MVGRLSTRSIARVRPLANGKIRGPRFFRYVESPIKIIYSVFYIEFIFSQLSAQDFSPHAKIVPIGKADGPRSRDFSLRASCPGL